MKFSFDFPEPSVEFAGYQVSFRVYTYENTYAMDPGTIRVERSGDALVVRCSGLTWAGGQERRKGSVTGTVRKTAQGISVEASATVPRGQHPLHRNRAPLDSQGGDFTCGRQLLRAGRGRDSALLA